MIGPRGVSGRRSFGDRVIRSRSSKPFEFRDLLQQFGALVVVIAPAWTVARLRPRGWAAVRSLRRRQTPDMRAPGGCPGARSDPGAAGRRPSWTGAGARVHSSVRWPATEGFTLP